MIPLIDLKKEHKSIQKEINIAIKRVLSSCDFILGDELKSFEKEFANYLGIKYAVGVSSGTDALELALRSLGIRKGDEVIVPVYTFYSTAAAVCYTGAKPVFVDVEEDTANIDPNKVEEILVKKKLNKNFNVKAIISVHLFGQPCNIIEISKIAKKYGLKVIEDASQAHGAEVNLEFKIDGKPIAKKNIKKVGTIGDIGCFSFYPTKNLGCFGDGGMVVTSDKSIYEKLKLLRDYGRVSKYEHLEIGYNKRLDDIQAAILRVKLKKLDNWNGKRKEIASIYTKYLKDIKEIELLENKFDSVYHLFVVKVKNRDFLYKFLDKNGIKTGIHYPKPLHLQECFRFLGYKKGDFPVAEKLSKQVLSLPINPFIDERVISKVCFIINNFYEKNITW